MSLVFDGDSSVSVSTVSGNPRILGDFTNGTLANRVMFQSSVLNGSTSVGILPNGTSTIAVLNVFSSSDPTNASIAEMRINNGATEARFSSGITGTGTYLPMTFYTGGSERMRIDTSGNVGIGTSSPFGRLDISAGSTYTNLFISNTYTGNADSRNWMISNSWNTFGDLSFVQSNARYGNPASSGTTRMVLDSSGNLLVGTTNVDPIASATNGFSYYIPNGTLRLRSNGTCIALGTNASSDLQQFYYWNGSSNAKIGSISNTTTATAYNTSSDYRLKENIQPMQNALAVVQQLNPVTYTWKADGSDGQGFIAHELQAVVPDCVTGEKDAVDENGNPVYQGVDTSFLVATLTKAIQELKAELDNAKERIAVLENK